VKIGAAVNVSPADPTRENACSLGGHWSYAVVAGFTIIAMIIINNITTFVTQTFVLIDAFGGSFVIFILVAPLGKVFFVLLFASAPAEFFVVIVLLSPLIGGLFSIDDGCNW
jgi:hypothetical protein